jgi:hypothetical protein
MSSNPQVPSTLTVAELCEMLSDPPLDSSIDAISSVKGWLRVILQRAAGFYEHFSADIEESALELAHDVIEREACDEEAAADLLDRLALLAGAMLYNAEWCEVELTSTTRAGLEQVRNASPLYQERVAKKAATELGGRP